MDASDPRHGTYAGAQAHIRTRVPMCDDCHTSFLRYRRRRRYDAAVGRTRVTPTAPVIAHLNELRGRGVTVRAIAARAGVSDSLIDELLNRPRPVIRTDNANALLATNPPPVAGGQVPAQGTVRRVRALARLGWSMRDITAASGGAVKLEALRNINTVDPEHVKVATADAVAAAYATLCMTTAPAGRTASQVRTRAIRKRWAPPLAWDDIDNDPQPSGTLSARTRDPKPSTVVEESVVLALLSGRSVASNRAEKVEAMRRWLIDGRSERSLCVAHGWHEGRYGRNAA